MFSHYFKSYVCITVTGPQVGRFLNLCANRNIEIWDVCVQEYNYSMKMKVRDFFRIKDIIKKTGSKVRIKHKQGFYFWLNRQTKRKLFLAGPFLCLFLLWLLSRFLWAVDVVGNRQISKDMLMDFLVSQGVYYGMPLSEIPIEDIKTEIRRTYPQINWVSVSIEGVGLQIRMKENDVWLNEAQGQADLNLISPVSGTVTDILVRKGTAAVKRGDQVKLGDVLIEGRIPIMNEDGTLKKNDYVQADGDVWIMSQQPIFEKLQFTYEKKEFTGEQRSKFYLEWGEKKWGVDIRPVPYLNYDIVEERSSFMLFDNVPLPFSFCRRVYREFYPVESKYSAEEAEKILNMRLEKIITTLEEKGVQIIEKNVKIVSNDVSMSLQGSLTLLEMHNQQKQLEDKEK